MNERLTKLISSHRNLSDLIPLLSVQIVSSKEILKIRSLVSSHYLCKIIPILTILIKKIMMTNIFEIHGYKVCFIENIHNVTVLSFLIYLFIFPFFESCWYSHPQNGSIYLSIKKTEHVVYGWTVSTGMASSKANRE